MCAFAWALCVETSLRRYRAGSVVDYVAPSAARATDGLGLLGYVPVGCWTFPHSLPSPPTVPPSLPPCPQAYAECGHITEEELATHTAEVYDLLDAVPQRVPAPPADPPVPDAKATTWPRDSEAPPQRVPRWAVDYVPPGYSSVLRDPATWRVAWLESAPTLPHVVTNVTNEAEVDKLSRAVGRIARQFALDGRGVPYRVSGREARLQPRSLEEACLVRHAVFKELRFANTEWGRRELERWSGLSGGAVQQGVSVDPNPRAAPKNARYSKRRRRDRNRDGPGGSPVRA